MCLLKRTRNPSAFSPLDRAATPFPSGAGTHTWPALTGKELTVGDVVTLILTEVRSSVGFKVSQVQETFLSSRLDVTANLTALIVASLCCGGCYRAGTLEGEKCALLKRRLSHSQV